MMKPVYTKSVTVLLALMALVMFPGCVEEEDEGAAKLAQEQRYFDLYMGSTFHDTIDAPTASGLFYIEFSEGSGESPGSEDWVMVNYVGYKIPGDVVVDTYIENVLKTSSLDTSYALYGPHKMQNGTRHEGLTEGLTMMREGGQAILCYTSELGYGPVGTTLMSSIPAYQSLRYEVELLEVIGDDIEGYEEARLLSYVDTIVGVDTIWDESTQTAMYFVIDETNEEGSPIENDSIVEIAYKGYLIDGRVFDESAEDAPYTFTVGDYSAETSPISGWHLGVSRFREGEKGRLIIPYILAYGEFGSVLNNQVAIPPYETLVFDIEIVSVSSTATEDPEEDE